MKFVNKVGNQNGATNSITLFLPAPNTLSERERERERENGNDWQKLNWNFASGAPDHKNSVRMVSYRNLSGELHVITMLGPPLNVSFFSLLPIFLILKARPGL
jgi:hypothetical protein